MTSVTAAAVIVERDWDLYEDWCEAVGATASPVDVSVVEMFIAEVGGRASTKSRYVRSIRAHLRSVGERDPLAGDRGSTLRVGEGWLSIAEATSRQPTRGFPAGVRGRRNALLLTILGVLQMTRAEARSLVPADISEDGGVVTVGGRLVHRSEIPSSCPACTVARWLQIVGPVSLGFRSTVRDVLDVDRDESSHDCVRLPARSEWDYVPALLPGIDRYGWARNEQMSTVAMSNLMRAAQFGVAEREELTRIAPRPGPGEPVRLDQASSADLARAYDEVDEALSALMDRLETVLDAGESLAERVRFVE